MILGQHLILQEVILSPAAEQLPPFDGWLVARVAQGVGYWLQPSLPASQLNPGDGFVIAQQVASGLRASQLDPLKLQYFTVQPYDLEGLLTVVEWHRIELARRKPRTFVRFFKSGDPIGQKFSRLAGLSHAEQLPLRCALLQLWAAATTELTAEEVAHLDDGNKLRSRFWQLLSRMTRTELCFSAPLELARRINCSERHFRGLFRKEFGVSLYAYQSALRMNFDRALPREISPKPIRSRRPARRFSLTHAQLIPGERPEDIGNTGSTSPAGKHPAGTRRSSVAAYGVTPKQTA